METQVSALSLLQHRKPPFSVPHSMITILPRSWKRNFKQMHYTGKISYSIANKLLCFHIPNVSEMLNEYWVGNISC